ncbi:MAG: hypothetical protein ACTSSM_13435 [Promethearchaeota archaeon]
MYSPIATAFTGEATTSVGSTIDKNPVAISVCISPITSVKTASVIPPENL